MEFLVLHALLATEILTTNEVLDAATSAISAGYSDLWISEGRKLDSFVLCSAISSGHPNANVRVGTVLTSSFTRTPVLIAMAAIALDEISRHKTFLTIGAGEINHVEAQGLHFDKPLARTKECISIVREVLNATNNDFVEYKGSIFNVRLKVANKPHPTNIEVFMTAHHPKMLQLAGEFADGIVLSHFSLKALDYVKQNIEIGASRSRRDPSRIRIFTTAPAALDDPDSKLAFMKLIAHHFAMPNLRHLISLAGYEEEKEKIEELMKAGKEEAALQNITEDMVKEVTLGYTKSAIEEKIGKLRHAGVEPIIFPAFRESHHEDIAKIFHICSEAMIAYEGK